MPIRLTTLFFNLFLITAMSSYGQDYVGLHGSVNRDYFKLLDSGVGLSSAPGRTNTVGVKFRRFLRDYSFESGLIYKRFEHPTGIINNYNSGHHFYLPLQFNAHFLINKKNRIHIVPSFGAYIGAALNENAEYTGEGSGPPFFIDRAPIQYQTVSKIYSNRFGLTAGLGVEFSLPKKAILRIDYSYVTGLKKIYDNKIEYTTNGIIFYEGFISSNGAYGALNVNFYYPIKIRNRKNS